MTEAAMKRTASVESMAGFQEDVRKDALSSVSETLDRLLPIVPLEERDVSTIACFPVLLARAAFMCVRARLQRWVWSHVEWVLCEHPSSPPLNGTRHAALHRFLTCGHGRGRGVNSMDDAL